MEQLLAQIPKKWLLVGIFAGALVLIFASNPPHTPCQTQTELFMKSHEKDLKLKTRAEDVEKSRLKLLEEACKSANNAGGCEPFFRKLRVVVRDLNAVPEECRAELGEEKRLRDGIKDAIILFLQMGWGFTPPVSSGERMGWMEPQDILLFCQLEGHYTRMSGAGVSRKLLDEVRPTLPGADSLETGEVWKKSLFGVDCRAYER